jgi:putative peptidoglycan lipid II flippase
MLTKMSAARHGGLTRSALILVLSGLTLALGLAVQVVLAAKLGVGRAMDIFLAASTLPTLITTVAFSAFAYFLVPLLKMQDAAPPETRACLVGRVVRFTALLSLAALLLLMAAAPWLIRFLVPGFDAGSGRSAAWLLRIMAAGCFFDIMRSALTAVEYSRERFLLPQLAPSVNHLLMLLSALFFLAPFGLTGLAIAWAAGSIAMFVMVAGALRGVPLLASGDARDHTAGRTTRALAMPVMFVVAVGQLVPVIDRLVASTLEPGAISALGYGSKMLDILLRTVPMAIGLAAFPVFSARAAKEDWQGLATAFSSAFRWLVVAVVPIAATVVVFRLELVRILFERGVFDQQATLSVASTCGWYAAALVPAAMVHLLQALLFALRRGWVLGAVGAGSLLTTALLDVALSRLVGVQGIAIAFLCVAGVQLIAVLLYMVHAWPTLVPRRLGLLIVQVGLGFAGMVLSLEVFFPRVWPPGLGTMVIRVAAGSAAAVLIYVALLASTKNSELCIAVRGISRYLAEWKLRRDGKP